MSALKNLCQFKKIKTKKIKDFDEQWIEEDTYVASITEQGNGSTDPSTPEKISVSHISRKMKPSSELIQGQ